MAKRTTLKLGHLNGTSTRSSKKELVSAASPKGIRVKSTSFIRPGSKQGTLERFLVRSPMGAEVRKRPLGATDVKLQAAGAGGESSMLLESRSADEVWKQDSPASTSK